MVRFGTLHRHPTRRQGTVDVKSFGHPCYNTRPILEEHPDFHARQPNERPPLAKTPMASHAESRMTKRSYSFPVQNREERDMSTSASSSPSLHPTRRQLDELDALMERMLEVPVKAAEEEPQGAANPRALSPESSAESSSAFDFHSPSPVHDNSVSPPTEPHGQTPFVIQSATSSAIPGSLAGSRESSPSS